jgi:hypothetical protein
MLRRNIALSLILGSLTVSGCASIVDGTSQTVTFNSNPNGATIAINGTPVGVTPLSTQVKRSKDMVIAVSKKGYEAQQMPLQTKINTYFWGNILCGGFLGSTTDGVSGAMIEYSPNMYYTTLEPMSGLQERQSFVPGVEKGVLRRNRFEIERRLRNFILVTHEQLSSDLAKGEGEVLSALYSMLNQEQAKDRTLSSLRTLASLHQEPPSFAEAIVDQLLEM